jgi:undecaprenyl-diphosphatase
MTSFDQVVLAFFNGLAHRWSSLDAFVVVLSTNDLLKGGVVVAVLWALWFTATGDAWGRRAQILATLFGAFAALFVGRVLQLTLPFRPRPIDNPNLILRMPFSAPEPMVRGWSSFPSDHAVLFFALATGVSLISRRVGVLLTSYVIVIVTWPRLYLGLHYPTDIVAGAMIGIAVAWLTCRSPHLRAVWPSVLRSSHRRAPLFYALAFLLTFEIATLFDTVREWGSLWLKILQDVVRHSTLSN